MTYSLINKCAKNYYNRTFIVPVIAKNVVTCFFLRHSVLSNRCLQRVFDEADVCATFCAIFLADRPLKSSLWYDLSSSSVVVVYQ